jgi:hypothetical protein
MLGVDSEANLREFLRGRTPSEGRHPEGRYASFDYCYNYFQSFRESGSIQALASPENLQSSCLHLGFFLASWGMFRGSSLLLNRSVRFFAPVIRVIASSAIRLWEIDAHVYTEDNIRELLHFRRTIAEAWGPQAAPSDILATKIMLAVFANIPAFDNFFKNGLGVSTFGAKALEKVARFYDANSELVDRYRVPTLDFATGQPTHRRYTRAKVIDMVFFMEGAKKARAA